MFEEILAALGRIFQKRSIPYMVIGGQAVLLYGEPRVTRDIDITLGVDTGHLDEFDISFEEKGFRKRFEELLKDLSKHHT